MNNRRFRIPVTVLLCGAITAIADSVAAQANRPEKQPVTDLSKPAGGPDVVPHWPDLNQKIVAFCEAHLGKQVGNGECAALAEQALREAGAKPRHELTAPQPNRAAADYVWGELLQPTDPVFPGDILQFRDVKLNFRLPNGSSVTQSLARHTAIVYRVHAPGAFTILEQNVRGPGNTGQRRVVQPGMIDVRAMTQGTIWAFRPVPKAEPVAAD